MGIFDGLKKVAQALDDVKEAVGDVKGVGGKAKDILGEVGLGDQFTTTTSQKARKKAKDEALRKGDPVDGRPRIPHLASIEEVRDITGVPVVNVGDYLDTDMVGQTFTTKNNSDYFDLRILIDPTSADTVWEMIKENALNGEETNELGDATIWSRDDTIFVRYRDQIITAFGNRETVIRDTIKKLAQLIMTRV